MILLVCVSNCQWLLAEWVWSISPISELLPLDWSCRRPFASGGSNSDADKVNQTWSRHLVGNQSQTSVNDESLASSHRFKIAIGLRFTHCLRREYDFLQQCNYNSHCHEIENISMKLWKVGIDDKLVAKTPRWVTPEGRSLVLKATNCRFRVGYLYIWYYNNCITSHVFYWYSIVRNRGWQHVEIPSCPTSLYCVTFVLLYSDSYPVFSDSWLIPNLRFGMLAIYSVEQT